MKTFVRMASSVAALALVAAATSYGQQHPGQPQNQAEQPQASQKVSHPESGQPESPQLTRSYAQPGRRQPRAQTSRQSANESSDQESNQSSENTAENLSQGEIRQIQQALEQKGFEVGRLDGKRGPKFKRALSQFQRKQGLQQTGMPDEQTLAILGIGGGASSSGQGPSETGSMPDKSTQPQQQQPDHDRSQEHLKTEVVTPSPVTGDIVEPVHPQAAHDLPKFVPAPTGTDVLMVVTAAILAIAVVAFGVLFLRLHSLPERVAHRSEKVQMQLVSVLCLISLFTHMHIFWIIGLLLAFIDIPDFGTPLRRIAHSVESIGSVVSVRKPASTPQELPPDAHNA